MRKEMHAKQFRYMLRVTLQMTKSSLGSFSNKIDQERKRRDLNAEEYPNFGNHIAIFECDLKIPPIMSLLTHTHLEFMLATRLNYANWHLVDLDNYMQGNKPFLSAGDEQEQEEWQKKMAEFRTRVHKDGKISPPAPTKIKERRVA